MEAFFLLKNVSFSYGEYKSFYSLMRPATQWCMPQNSTCWEASKGSENPWRWKTKKDIESFPLPLSCHSAALHPYKSGAAEEVTALRNLFSILWELETQRKYCGKHNGKTGKGKKCISGFTAICSEPTNRIPSGRVKNTGSKISPHLNNRHVGLDSPPPLALFKQPSAACKQSLRRLCSVRIISAF